MSMSKTKKMKKTKKVSKSDKMPTDIGNFGAYMYVDPKGPRVMVFYYVRIGTNYKYATFDNFVDSPGDADEPTLKSLISHLFHKYEMYNGITRTPIQMHELIKDKVSKFYSLKWVEKNYDIIGNDLHNLGFI